MVSVTIFSGYGIYCNILHLRYLLQYFPFTVSIAMFAELVQLGNVLPFQLLQAHSNAKCLTNFKLILFIKKHPNYLYHLYHNYLCNYFFAQSNSHIYKCVCTQHWCCFLHEFGVFLNTKRQQSRVTCCRKSQFCHKDLPEPSAARCCLHERKSITWNFYT